MQRWACVAWAQTVIKNKRFERIAELTSAIYWLLAKPFGFWDYYIMQINPGSAVYDALVNRFYM